MNTPDYTSSKYMPDDTSIDSPQYPMPPGGQWPDLNLAGADGFNVASGSPAQPMPEPGKPMPMDYALSGNPAYGGVDPSNPVPPAPNLAGVDGVPSPAMLMRDTTSSTIITPDFIEPDFASLHQTVKPYDLTGPGINYAYGGEFEPDPMVPDLTSYNMPMGLDIHNISGTGPALFRPDPMVGDLINYDVPNGIGVLRNPLEPDPSVPDLQDPQLDQAVKMQDRPGELSHNALDTMHMQPTYQQMDGVPYAQSFMDQSGNNTRRRRHLDLMQSGLDGAS